MDFIENAVKNLVEKGAFGPAKFVSVSFSEEEKNLTHFASVINFFEINIDDGESKKIKAVLKRSPQSEEDRQIFNSDLQFKNEFYMYSEVMSFLKCENISPKFFYGECEVEKKEFMILEDLKTKGYLPAKQKVCLDLKHLSIAVDKLGKFHGSSYKAKRNGSELNKLPLFKGKTSKDFYYMTYHSMMRGIKPISDKELERLSEKMANMEKLVEKLQEPEEPYGVICHGDFNRNNMFFLYENDEPIDVRFYDFQLSRYNSPATDLSFLLYMNTDVQVRKEWDFLLGAYWKGVTSVEPDPGFGFEQFCRHFAQKALYGYMLSSFYLPMMMAPEQELEDVASLTHEEKIDQMITRGGDEGTIAVSNMMQHLIQRGYIQALNNSY